MFILGEFFKLLVFNPCAVNLFQSSVFLQLISNNDQLVHTINSEGNSGFTKWIGFEKRTFHFLTFLIESASNQISTWTEKGFILFFMEIQSKMYLKKTW